MFRQAAIGISFPSVTASDPSRSSVDCITIIGWKRRSLSARRDSCGPQDWMKTSSNNLSRCLTRANVRIKVERELATRSLREFVSQAWSIVEPSRVFIPGRHIDAIIDHLEAVSYGHIRRLLINVPPR